MRLSLLISLSSARFDFVNGVPLHRADTVSLLRCCSQPTSLYLSFQKVFLVRDKVLETLRLTASELKSDVSTNSTNPAYFGYIISHNFYFVKRKFPSSASFLFFHCRDPWCPYLPDGCFPS